MHTSIACPVHKYQYEEFKLQYPHAIDELIALQQCSYLTQCTGELESVNRDR